jgi:N6-adenosine-specific RNA methylase IME4
MLQVHTLLANGKRGDQAALERMRCVRQNTVSDWRATCDVVDAVGKHRISDVCHVQPSHAVEIARHFRRREGKEWSDEVKEQVTEWVERCEAEEWTVQELRQALLAEPTTTTANGPGGASAAVEEYVRGGGHFATVYADPPWRYDNQATRAATDNHYQTMTPTEIAGLTIAGVPVAGLVEDNAHLWLWTTNAFLFQCPRVIESWGFEYKSVFVWCKPQMGIGNYLRVAHEFLLFAVRGRAPFRACDIRSWKEYARGEHSSKPEPIRRDVIERASPGPYLELFGRREIDGWSVWGNQVERDLFSKEVAS